MYLTLVRRTINVTDRYTPEILYYEERSVWLVLRTFIKTGRFTAIRDKYTRRVEESCKCNQQDEDKISRVYRKAINESLAAEGKDGGCGIVLVYRRSSC